MIFECSNLWRGTALLISRWFCPDPMKRALVQSTWSPDGSQHLQSAALADCVCVVSWGWEMAELGDREASPGKTCPPSLSSS